MSKIVESPHAQESRINRNFQISENELSKVNRVVKDNKRYYVIVRKYWTEQVIIESNGHRCQGDMIVGVVENKEIITWLLGRSVRKDYYQDGKLL